MAWRTYTMLDLLNKFYFHFFSFGWAALESLEKKELVTSSWNAAKTKQNDFLEENKMQQNDWAHDRRGLNYGVKKNKRMNEQKRQI